MKTLYNRIKERREELNLTQEELAEKLGYKSRSSINKIEMGINDLPQSKIVSFAKVLKTTPGYLMGWEDLGDNFITLTGENDFLIPVLASVPCGEAYEAVENAIEELHINGQLYNKGVRYALKADGDSMYPKIENGDTMLIKPTPQVESGSIAIVKVNDYEATCKKVLINENGITLIPLNTSHEAVMYSMQEVLDLPVTIIGRVMEVRKEL